MEVFSQIRNPSSKLGVEALTFITSSLESEAGQSVVQGQPVLQTSVPGQPELNSETLSQTKQN